VWANEPTDAVADALRSVKVDRVVTCVPNAHFHARFALALTATTEYVAVFDDDAIPGSRWFENCLETYRRTPGILGTAGVILHEGRYCPCSKHGWHSPSTEAVQVDLVGHAWFLRAEWVHYLFAVSTLLGTNGEDIELAARAWRLGGISAYCPPHPPDDRGVWGSTLGSSLGDDEAAAFRRARHVAERDQIVQVEIAAGWQPLFMRRSSIARVEADHDGVALERNKEAEQPSRPVMRCSKIDRSDSTLQSRLLSLLGPQASRILDIRCGDGSLGVAVKERQQATVDGIDRDERLGELARSRLDQVWVGDITKQGTTIQESSFDAIMCDRFECLREPGQVLRLARTWLKADGEFIATVGNVRQHAVVEGLLEGNWQFGSNGNQKGNGNGHLRFFTRREIEKLFYRSGFNLIERQILPGEGYNEWIRRGRPGDVQGTALRIGGMSEHDAEEFYVDRYFVKSVPARLSEHGLTSIVIVTHNQLQYTRQCVESIRERTDEPYELIFVDNGSSDGTMEYLSTLLRPSPCPLPPQRGERGEVRDPLPRRGQRVRGIRNDQNRGFPAAVNQGIQIATGQQILLLNNDTIVTTGWLRRLLRAS
jgi:GT2 family glycosyltransferase/2-polyprenyl-3-methyl-5-hydroxy-6-metoxy-1,4-benzoquinol methylase